MRFVSLFVLACSFHLPAMALPATRQDPADSRPSIKRHLFSSDSFAGIKSEFDKLKIVLDSAPQAPAAGTAVRVFGTGPSGFGTPFAIEHADAAFHVYAVRRRPQHPHGPLPYATQEVVFNTPDPEVAPVGILTYPKTGGPFPALVLLAGSGAHDRDAGMSLHKTLLVLADHLSRKGFAVLRYDKRGVGLSGGQRHPMSTIDDYAADALAAVRFLRMQPNIAADQIGLLGHSEGGIIAPMVAARAPREVRFVVMLGAPGLPGVEIKALQDAAMRRAEGMPESLVLLNQQQERELHEIAASKRSHAEALAAMRAATLALPAATRSALEIGPEGIPDHAFEALLTPWSRHFLALDPRAYLAQVACPVLALAGEKDLQVPPAENLKAIRLALPPANAHSSVRQLAGLNHAFQSARSGHPHEYLLIEETVAPSALALMADWMHAVVRDPAGRARRPAGRGLDKRARLR